MDGGPHAMVGGPHAMVGGPSEMDGGPNAMDGGPGEMDGERRGATCHARLTARPWRNEIPAWQNECLEPRNSAGSLELQ